MILIKSSQISIEIKKQKLKYKVKVKLSFRNTKISIDQQQNSSDKIIASWSISIIKLISIQTKSSYSLYYKICQNCLHRVFVSISSTSVSPNSNKQNISNHYCIKCQFYDGNQTYLGQICEQAGKKVFAVQDEIMKVQFFQQTNANFKQVIVRQVIGDTIKAIIAITNEDIGNGVNLRGFYLVDLLSFIGQQTQQSFNESIICEVKNQIKQLSKMPSNKSIR